MTSSSPFAERRPRLARSAAVAIAIASCAARPTSERASTIGQAAPYGHDRTALDRALVAARRPVDASTAEASVDASATEAGVAAASEPYAPELRVALRDEAAGEEPSSGEDATTGAMSTVSIEDASGSLDRAYSAMAESLRRARGAKFTVVVLGDSHTESDEFTSRLRRRLGATFGSAGRGFVAPAGGARDVRRTFAGPWTIERAPLRNASGAYGVGLARAIARDRAATVEIEPCARCESRDVSRFVLYFRRQNGGGSIEARVDGGPWERQSTALAPNQGPVGFLVSSTQEGHHTITVRPAGDGPIELHGVALERDGNGATVDSAGTVGAQATHLDTADWTVLGPELSARNPSLVVLWFGTNESANRRLAPARVEQAITSLVARVRAAVPRASILVLGPPDLALRDGAGGFAQPAQQLTILDAIRRGARNANAAYFDLLSAMGGPGTIVSWVARTPPLAYRDHVHYRPAGYDALSGLLLDAIARGYEGWAQRAARRPAAERSTTEASPAPDRSRDR